MALGAFKSPVATTHPYKNREIGTTELGKSLPWHSSSLGGNLEPFLILFFLMIKSDAVCFKDQLLYYFPSHNTWLYIGPLLNEGWRQGRLGEDLNICVSAKVVQKSQLVPTCRGPQSSESEIAKEIQAASVLKVPSHTELLCRTRGLLTLRGSQDTTMMGCMGWRYITATEILQVRALARTW